MSRDLRNTSLSVQAAQLKKTLENRERRRQADKYARLLEKDDNEEGRPAAASTAAGTSGTEARFAALAAIPMHEQQVYHCELCQANFTADAAYQQHLQSAVHHKAVEKAREEEARIQRMQAAGLHDIQQMALGAAGWASTHGATGHPSGSGARSHGTHQAASVRGRGAAAKGGSRGNGPSHRGGRNGGASSSNDVLSHQQITAAMRAETEPLHIDGWVPPAVNIQPVQADVQQQLPLQPERGMEDDALIGVHNLAAGREQAEDSGSSPSSSGGSEQGEELGPVAGGGDLLGLGYGGGGAEASTDSADEESSSSESADEAGQQGTVSFF